MPRSGNYIDSEDLIAEVKKRPGIFNKSDPETYRQNYKELLWVEIASSKLENWSQLSEYEKKDRVVDLKKKWRNLRDSFLKELQYRARLKAGLENKRKRKYVYFDQLSFLRPILETSEKSVEKPLPSTERNRDNDRSLYKKQMRKKPKDLMITKDYIPKKKAKRAKKLKGEIDEDKTFLLSLVPSFRTMHEDQKLMAKIEILNIIRQIKGSSIDTPLSKTNLSASTSGCDPIKVEHLVDGDSEDEKEELADSEDDDDDKIEDDKSSAGSTSSPSSSD